MKSVVGTETRNLMDEVIRSKLRYAKDNPEDDKGSVHDAVDLLEKATQIDQLNADILDKEARRRIEESKNSTMLDCEKEKQRITWQRAGLELAKVIVPTLISIGAYNVFQKRMFFFEKDNRVCSSTGRQLQLPKFMK